MKKFVFSLLFVLALFGTKTACSQSFNAGLLAGGITSQVDGDHYSGFHQFGWTAGAYVNLPVTEHLSTQMELKYSLMGAHHSVKEVVDYGYNPFSLRLHYAEIPLMLRYDFGHFRAGYKSLDFIALELGVSIDLRLKASEDTNGDYQVTTERWNFFSMTGNVGVHFDITDHIGLGVRWMYSIVPIRFTGNPGWFYNQYYNNVLQATVTFNLTSPVR